MHKYSVIFFCFVFCLCLGCNPDNADGKGNTGVKPPENEMKEDVKVSFETIASGSNSGHEEKKDYVITNEKDWKELWNKVQATVEPKPELPKIDFEKEIVLAVFKGTQTSGGHSITIEDVKNSAKGWDVKVKEVSPEPGGMMMMVMTQPYHIVKTQKTDKQVMFKRD